MRFSPEEIEGKEFLPVLRGYDKAEVDGFLRAVAADYRALQQTIASAPATGAHADGFAHLGDHVATVLRAAADAADACRADAEARRQAIVDDARAVVREMVSRLQAELQSGLSSLVALSDDAIVDLRAEPVEPVEPADLADL